MFPSRVILKPGAIGFSKSLDDRIWVSDVDRSSIGESDVRFRSVAIFIVFALLVGNIKDVYFFSLDGTTQLLLTVFIMGLLVENPLNKKMVISKL